LGPTYLEKLVSATPLNALGEDYWPINSLTNFLDSTRLGDSCQESEKQARALIALLTFLNDSGLDVPDRVMNDGVEIIVRAAKNKNSSGWWFYSTWLTLAYPRVPYSYATKFTGEFEKANLSRRVNWELLGDWAFVEGKKQDAMDFWHRAARVSKWNTWSAREKYAHLLLSESQSKKAFQEFKKISNSKALVSASGEFEKVGDVPKSIALAQMAVAVRQDDEGLEWLQDESADSRGLLQQEEWLLRLLARNGNLELALVSLYSRAIFCGRTTSDEYRKLLAEFHAFRGDDFAYDFWSNGAWWAKYKPSTVAWMLFDVDHVSWAPLRWISTGEKGKLPSPTSSTQTLKIIDDFFVEIQREQLQAPIG
jgi:hypothetical protein